MIARAKPRRQPQRLALWLLCPAIVGLALGASGADDARLACTISSEKQNGTVLTFDPAAKVLAWGSGRRQVMTLEVDTADPFEIKAVSQRQDSPKVSFHVWAERDRLRFTANNDGYLFVGACERLP